MSRGLLALPSNLEECNCVLFVYHEIDMDCFIDIQRFKR